MFQNYLKIAFRNLMKNKIYSIIIISGMAVGVALFILVMLYCHFYLSYNKFHKDVDEIYCLTNVTMNDRHYVYAPISLQEAWLEEIPEVPDITRYRYGRDRIISYEDKKIMEERIRFVDNEFLKVFSYEMISGNLENALTEPNTVVLSESIARKYFGDADPIGKVLITDDSLNLQVTGILEDHPKNSSVNYNLLISHSTLQEKDVWDSWATFFIRIPDKYDKSILIEQIKSINEKYIPDEEDRAKDVYFLPFTKLYFRPQYITAGFSMVPALQYYMIMSLASALLLVVCLNFMNLTTAKYMNRAKEVGMRKIIGAHRKQIIRQFMGESILISFIALPLGLLFYLAFRPTFINFMRMDVQLYIWDYPILILYLLFVTILVGIISGSYPALLLSGFKAINVIKGNIKQGLKSETIRKVLVVIQFTLSIVLIISAVVVTRQFDHLTKVDLGYDRNEIVVVELHNKVVDKIDVFKNEILNNPDVVSVGKTQYPPVDWGSGPGSKIIPEGLGEESAVRIKMYPSNDELIKTLGIKLINGRSFSKDFNEENNCLISEASAKLLPWDDPIGKQISSGELTVTIIGVVNNFHFDHVFRKLAPTMFYFNENNCTYLLIKTLSGKTDSVIHSIKKMWNNISIEFPVETWRLDEFFIDNFKSTVKGQELINLISIVSIFFSCLGLLGLASFTIERKTKEIAIRKVVGATANSILKLLLSKFMFLVILSNFIALPIAYYLSHLFINWAWVYSIKLKADIFIFAALLSIIIAIPAVIFQSLKAIYGNPADALKCE
ncbi:MAG: ABC transporter permease [Candidatus Cloacimonetes bacterium]|nr:ABC transporter permease [Candidatus Cloacimonadota bacterium]